MLVILRHAEPRRGEPDPTLTSAGQRMAREAAEWVVAHLPPDSPVGVRHTPTQRTRQTAEAVCARLADRARVSPIDVLPESLVDLDILADHLCGHRPGLPRPRLPPTVLVGHHTTLVGLARELGILRSQLDPRHYTAGCVLVRVPGEPPGWSVQATWRGRPS